MGIVWALGDTPLGGFLCKRIREVKTMTTIEAAAEVFWTAFRALPKKERKAIVEKLMRDREFGEDSMIWRFLKSGRRKLQILG